MVETLHVTTVRSLFRNWQAGTGQAGRWTPFEVLEELDDHSILRFPVVAKRQDEGDRHTSRAAASLCNAIRRSHDCISDNFGDLHLTYMYMLKKIKISSKLISLKENY